MALLITGSPNISEFDYSADYNLNTQELTLNDASTYIGGGAALVQGIDFILTSPSGLIYYENTSFGASADIDCAAPTAVVKSMPTFQGAVEYGIWTIEGTIRDEDDTDYSLTKTTSICKPNQCDSVTGTSDACAVIDFTANCQTNKAIYEDNTVYTYNGVTATSVDYDVTMSYPLSSGLANITSANVPFFSTTPVYDGQYCFYITNTALYEFDDNTSITIVYNLNQCYNATCSLSLCGILCAYQEFLDKFQENNTDGTNKAKLSKYNINNVVLLNSYVQQAIIKNNCGEDFSDLIELIEAITGSTCDCQCGGQNSNTAIVTTSDIVLDAGCGDISVDTVTVGNTTTFTINDMSYQVTSTALGVEITTSNPDPCTTRYDIGLCLESLGLCGSVFPIEDGNGGTVNANSGSTYETIVGLQNDATVVLEGRLDDLETIPTLNNITLLTTSGTVWATYGSSTPQYSKDFWGRVWLQGMATWSGTNPTTQNLIATLPVGYRPTVQRKFKALLALVAASSTTQSQFDVTIETTGNIYLTSGGDSVATSGVCFLSFDGINFIAA